jgi:hypothetical protein
MLGVQWKVQGGREWMLPCASRIVPGNVRGAELRFEVRLGAVCCLEARELAALRLLLLLPPFSWKPGSLLRINGGRLFDLFGFWFWFIWFYDMK